MAAVTITRFCKLCFANQNLRGIKIPAQHFSRIKSRPIVLNKKFEEYRHQFRSKCAISANRNIVFLDIQRKFSTGVSSTTVQDLSDIKELLALHFKEEKSRGVTVENVLNVYDILVQKRLDEISLSELKEKIADVDPVDLYSIASKVLILQSKVGDEACTVSVPLFELAALAGNKDAKYSYAQILCRGAGGMAADPVKASKLFTELAKEGHPYAQFALAGMYYTGFGIDQSYETSYTLYQVAAENGIVASYNSIGKMYLKGEGVDVDEKQAVKYFTTGAEKGDPQACLSLAHCYSNKKGVEEDFDKAFLYNQKAANMGYPAAIYNVGVHYFAGKGVGLDMLKAADYFKQAADMGFVLAEINLGNLYYHGLGVEKDLAKAKELYKRAAPKNQNARLLLEELEIEEKQSKNNDPDPN